MAAAALSSLSAPRATILKHHQGRGRCSAFASSHGAHPPYRWDHRHCPWVDGQRRQSSSSGLSDRCALCMLDSPSFVESKVRSHGLAVVSPIIKTYAASFRQQRINLESSESRFCQLRPPVPCYFHSPSEVSSLAAFDGRCIVIEFYEHIKLSSTTGVEPINNNSDSIETVPCVRHGSTLVRV